MVIKFSNEPQFQHKPSQSGAARATLNPGQGKAMISTLSKYAERPANLNPHLLSSLTCYEKFIVSPDFKYACISGDSGEKPNCAC